MVGFTTLADGSAVYASSGVAAGEGVLHLHNLAMPGVPGLDVDRTFTWAGGSVTLLAAAVPRARQVTGNWLNVDGRAGFIVRTGRHPISVLPTGVTLSDGPATRLTIEAHPAEDPARTAARAASPPPRTDRAELAASLAGGQLSLFNLGEQVVTGATATLPQDPSETTLYQGVQHTDPGPSTRYEVSLDAADALIAPARFAAPGPVPTGLTLKVVDSRNVEVTNAGDGQEAHVRLHSLATGETASVTVPPGTTAHAAFTQGPLLPTPDLARGRTTYPTSPLPAGMTDPAHAVDGDPRTAWSPGPAGGRMVVDLGATRKVGSVRLAWIPERGSGTRVEVSGDGKTYAPLPDGPVDARYIAVVTTGPGSLTDLAVLPPPSNHHEPH